MDASDLRSVTVSSVVTTILVFGAGCGSDDGSRVNTACPGANILVHSEDGEEISGPIEPADSIYLSAELSQQSYSNQIYHTWYFEEWATGSRAGIFPGSNSEATTSAESESWDPEPIIVIDLSGHYRVCVELCEVDGACSSDSSCEGNPCVDIEVVQPGDLYIELLWDHPGAKAKMHYLRSGAAFGDDTSDFPGGDCFYANRDPDYCIEGDDSDNPNMSYNSPQHTLDAIASTARNLFHDNPCDDTYRLWVGFEGVPNEDSETEATIRIHMDGELITESSRSLRVARSDHQPTYWKPGSIKWTGSTGEFIEATEDNYFPNARNPEQ